MADLTITAANVVLTTGTASSGTAGATVTAGQALYLDAATTTLKLAQCDGTAAEYAVVGIALHGSLANQPLSYARTGSTINIGATTAKTTTYLLSAAAGGIAPQADITSGQRIVRIGHATGTTGVLLVDIRDIGAAV